MNELHASEIYADGSRKIVVIEAVRCGARKFAGFCQLNASIEPAALIVCEAGGNQVIGLATSNFCLDELEREVAGLSALLAVV